MANEQNLKPFVKGDPRCWRNGRPRSHDALRALAQQIGAEVAKDKDGKPRIIDEHLATEAEIALRWLLENDPDKFLDRAYGKVPQSIETTGNSLPVLRVEVVTEEKHE